ncbi:MAG: adenylyltransferase/cytidyltransferase family protein, partial [Deltaproteobacteria bacterium]|nr:adenylyltransferase/cytidyltransferase family protein [Deltaproteobacteria bacterium]
MDEIKRSRKIVDLQGLRLVRNKNPQAKVVHCHGVFDVLHGGHLVYFESAKKFGDILIVTITADKFVNKGPNRPYFSELVRASMVAALEVVDYVTISPFPTAVQVISALRPDYYVKGPDYKDKARDVTGGIYEEENAVKAGGGKLVFTEDETFSSSTLINKFFAPWTDEQQQAIEVALKAGGTEKIEEVLDRISKLNVLVVGEP